MYKVRRRDITFSVLEIGEAACLAQGYSSVNKQSMDKNGQTGADPSLKDILPRKLTLCLQDSCYL